MVLKEAYSYQNFLDSLIREAESFLLSKNFMTTTKEKHLKKAANPEVDDEEIVLPKDYGFTPNQVIDFYMKALTEKNKLSIAITDAKKKAGMDIDLDMEMNKRRHGVINILRSLDRFKPLETKSTSSAYRINPTSGSQERYCYNVEVVTSIDFDRNAVRGIIKKLQKQADEISTKKDLVEITTTVEYVPIWDMSDTFEDILLP